MYVFIQFETQAGESAPDCVAHAVRSMTELTTGSLDSRRRFRIQSCRGGL